MQTQRKARVSWRKALLLALFPLMSYLANKHLYSTSLGLEMNPVFVQQCPASPSPNSPYRLPYTGIDGIDSTLCLLVAFFSSLISFGTTDSRMYTGELLSSLPAWELPILLDSAARIRNTPLSIIVPTVFLIVGQVYGGAIIFPYYYFLSILFKGELNTPFLNSVRSEALVFAVSVGHILPAFGVFLLDNVYANVLWQIFPLTVALLQGVYLIVRNRPLKPSTDPEDTYLPAVLTIIVSSIVHFGLLISSSSPPHFVSLFIPPLRIPHDGPVAALLYFLQWDGFLIFIAAYVFIMSMVPNLSVVDFIVPPLGVLLCSVLFGSGSAIAGLWIWGETKRREILPQRSR